MNVILKFFFVTVTITFNGLKILNWIHSCMSPTFTSLCLFMTVQHGELINILFQKYQKITLVDGWVKNEQVMNWVKPKWMTGEMIIARFEEQPPCLIILNRPSFVLSESICSSFLSAWAM